MTAPMRRPLDVEARLRAAAADASWPATPDLRAAVLARIASPAGDAAPTPAAPPVARRRPLVRALVLALVGLLALAGIATALGFRLPGLDILRVDRLPAAPALAGAPVEAPEVVPGSPVPLAEARALGRPRVLLPAVLPAPGTAFVAGTGDARMVTLAWHAARGAPALAGTDLALVLTAAPGSIEEPLLRKLVGPGTTIESVVVGEDRGWWIAGAPHELLILGPDGVTPLASRTAGDTLVLARDGTVYRLESALGRDATLEVAEGLR